MMTLKELQSMDQCPRSICWQYQAVWCDQHAGGKGCQSEGCSQASTCKPHEIQHGQVQGPAQEKSLCEGKRNIS